MVIPINIFRVASPALGVSSTTMTLKINDAKSSCGSQDFRRYLHFPEYRGGPQAYMGAIASPSPDLCGIMGSPHPVFSTCGPH